MLEKLRAAYLVLTTLTEVSAHPELNSNATSEAVFSDGGPGALMVSESEAALNSSHSPTCTALGPHSSGL